MSSWWVKDDTRDQKQGRDEGAKNRINTRKQMVAKIKQN